MMKIKKVAPKLVSVLPEDCDYCHWLLKMEGTECTSFFKKVGFMQLVLFLCVWQWELQRKWSGCRFHNLPSDLHLFFSCKVSKTLHFWIAIQHWRCIN